MSICWSLTGSSSRGSLCNVLSYRRFVFDNGLTINRNCTRPASNWVDFVPFLRNFPAWTMINRGKRLHQGLVDTCGGLINDVDRRMKAGEAVPDCMAKFLLSVREQEDLDDLDIVFICCAFMIGGVETVSQPNEPHVSLVSIKHLRHRRLQSSSGLRPIFRRSLKCRSERKRSSIMLLVVIVFRLQLTKRICHTSELLSR